jgi:hypothetical protein
VVATTKEKPYDDIHDYKTDLGPQYFIRLRKLKSPEKASARVMKRVRSKFELEIARKNRPS